MALLELAILRVSENNGAQCICQWIDSVWGKVRQAIMSLGETAFVLITDAKVERQAACDMKRVLDETGPGLSTGSQGRWGGAKRIFVRLSQQEVRKTHAG